MSSTTSITRMTSLFVLLLSLSLCAHAQFSTPEADPQRPSPLPSLTSDPVSSPRPQTESPLPTPTELPTPTASQSPNSDSGSGPRGGPATESPVVSPDADVTQQSTPTPDKPFSPPTQLPSPTEDANGGDNDDEDSEPTPDPGNSSSTNRTVGYVVGSLTLAAIILIAGFVIWGVVVDSSATAAQYSAAAGTGGTPEATGIDNPTMV